MSFIYIKFWPLILVGIFLFIYGIINIEMSYFRWIKRHWFFRRSKTSLISSIFYLLGFFLLAISLMDLRGPEEKIEADIPDQKTIIIIDSSASMLVEDVRPNRYKKSLLMARHFIKKAVGHQIAVVLFSDTQKRIVPFTDDLDLLDARVAGMEDNNIHNGGSNIIQAIQESIQYFLDEADSIGKTQGNILIFTDSEDTGGDFGIDVPSGVSVAAVGVGTLKGGKVPLRTKSGDFRTYKKYKGEDVVSKLDEEFLKRLGRKIPSFKYWIALSYSIPTEEIIDFFRSQHKLKTEKGSIRTRPVFAKYLMLPAMILLSLSLLMKNFRSFSTALILLIMPFLASANQKEEKLKEIDPKSVEYLEALSTGELGKEGRLKLAEGLLRSGRIEKAIQLYEENLSNQNSNDIKVMFNLGTAYILNGKRKIGIGLLADLKNRLETTSGKESKIIDEIRKNILLALKEQKKEQQQKDKDKDKKDKKKDQEKEKKEGDEKDQEEDSKNKNQKDSKQAKNKDQNKINKDKKDSKGKEKKEKKKASNEKNKEKEKKKPKTVEEKEDEIRAKRKLVKVPAILKQLLDDDRELQKQYMDTTTQNRSLNNDKKDW